MAILAHRRGVRGSWDHLVLAVAVGAPDHPMGRQSSLLPAVAVPGAIHPWRRVAVLGAFRLLWFAADRRSTVIAGLAALRAPRPAQSEPRFSSRGHSGADHARARRRGPAGAVSRSRMAPRRWPRGCHLLCVRRLSCLAHPACRPNIEPLLSPDRVLAPVTRLGAALIGLRLFLWRHSRVHGRGARPGRLSRAVDSDRDSAGAAMVCAVVAHGPLPHAAVGVVDTTDPRGRVVPAPEPSALLPWE